MSSKRKAFNFYRSYYDTAMELPEKARLEFLTAILQKQFEGIEPNLIGMAKFAYISQQHSINSQVKGWEDKTGQKLTPSVAPSVGGRQGGKQAPSVQEKEKEKEKVQLRSFNFKSALLDLGADKQLVEDWLKVRNKKKASNTETAFRGFKSQVDQSSLHINQILKECAERSWAGFKAEWLEKEQPKSQTKNPYYD